MTTPEQLHDLVERFERNRAAYRSGRYNETQVRREFIDPFFGLLGWDVANKQGYAPAYQDIVHEDANKIGGARKFFVEAKKPSVSLDDYPTLAFQLRRYA